MGVSTQVSFPDGESAAGATTGVAAVDRPHERGASATSANSYVFANKLDYALIRNEAGKFPVPGPGTIAAAADAVKTIPPDNAISITNPPASAPDAYPISTFTYVLFPTTSGKAKTLARLRHLRDRPRPEVRGEAAVRAVAREGGLGRQGDARQARLSRVTTWTRVCNPSSGVGARG